MFAQRAARLKSSLIRDILKLAQRPGVISFAGGLPNAEIMPPLDLADVPDAYRQYGPTEGEPELREAIAADLQKLGIDCDAEQVLITSGSQQGLDLIAKLFVDEGTPLAVESPTYLAALQVFELYGAKMHGLPLGPVGVDPQALDALLKREQPALCYLIPTFQNPTGCCYGAQTRAAVRDVLAASNTVLIEDEPYRELAYDAVDREPICAGLSERWCYLGSFSKTGIPGLRIGFLAASKELVQPLTRLKQATDLHSNRIGQYWALRALQSPQRAEQIEDLRNFYRERRDAMASALSEHMTAHAEWLVPAGGLFFWIKLHQRCDSGALLQRALKEDLAFMPGDPFFAGEPDASYLRLNFSHPTPGQIEEGVARLENLLQVEI
jgi:DNA-binding transcriptional MocR family regulator